MSWEDHVLCQCHSASVLCVKNDPYLQNSKIKRILCVIICDKLRVTDPSHCGVDALTPQDTPPSVYMRDLNSFDRKHSTWKKSSSECGWSVILHLQTVMKTETGLLCSAYLKLHFRDHIPTPKPFFLLLVYWWACCSFSPDFPLFLCDLIWFFSQLAVSSTHKCTPVRDVLMKPNTQSNSDETNSNQQEWRSCLLYSTLCLPASGFVFQSDKKYTDTSCFCIFATVTQHIEEVCAESPQWCSCITIPVGFKRLTITLTNWGPLWQCMESFTDPWALARVQILERYSALLLPVQHLGQRTRTSSHLRPEDAAGWDVSNNLVQCLRWTVRAEVHKSQYGRVWRR